MRAFWDEDFFRGAAFGFMEAAHHHEPRKLPLRSSRGLQADTVHAAHFAQHLLEAPHDLQGALCEGVWRERVEFQDPGYTRRPLVNFGVVLHRAGPERVELRVNAVVPLREAKKVTIRFGLAYLRQSRRFASSECP